MIFTEGRLESAIIELLKAEGFEHLKGDSIERSPQDVLIREHLVSYLSTCYRDDAITAMEIESVIKKLSSFPAVDLYESNKAVMKLISDGFVLKREDRSQKDLFIHLIDYSEEDRNIYRVVNQLEISGDVVRIPDTVVYINGIPLVVFEFKNAVREEATIYNAYRQITERYHRDIPELFKYTAFCVISDGVNNKAGSDFAPYEFFYSWRKTDGGDLVEKDGIDSLYSLIKGMFQTDRLRRIIRDFVYFPDTSRREEKMFLAK